MLILKDTIFAYIEKTKPGKGDEVWLTDSVELIRSDGHRIFGFVFDGTRYDIGTFESLREADKKMEQKEK